MSLRLGVAHLYWMAHTVEVNQDAILVGIGLLGAPL